MKTLWLSAILFGLGTPLFAQDTEPRCSGTWYDSVSCSCKGDAADRCSCGVCTGGEECPCMARIRKGTGTIRGSLKNRYFRYRPGIVFVRDVPGRKFVLPPKNPVMDQEKMTFIPHVLPVLVGSTVDFPNHDPVRHNVYSTKKSVKIFNLGQYKPGINKSVVFDTLGEIRLLCKIHLEMNATILVCQNPYFAATDKMTATFEIRNVPAGTYKLGVNHEKVSGKDIDVTVTAGKVTEVEFVDFSRRR